MRLLFCLTLSFSFFSPYLLAKEPVRPAELFSDLFDGKGLCKTSPDSISKEQALKDLEVLRRLFERGYAGEKELKIAGRNLNNRLEAIRKEVEKSTSLRVHDFLNAIHNNFRGIQDSNLAFKLLRQDGRTEIRRARYHAQAYYSRVRFREDNDSAEAINPELIGLPAGSFIDDCQEIRDVDGALNPFGRIQDSRLRVEYRLIQYGERPVRRSACFFKSEGQDDVRREIPFQRHKLNDPDSKPGVDKASNRNMPLVRPAPFEFSWLGSASYWPKEVAPLRDRPAMILDLRGRQGNWSLAAQKFAKALVGEKVDLLKHDRLESEVTLQAGRHFEHCNQNKLAQKQIQAYRQGYDDRMMDRWDPEKPDRGFKKFNRNITKEESKWLEHLNSERVEPAHYDGWIAIITNRSCQGACEELVSYLSQKKKVIRIGENTYGSLNYGGVLEYILPNSRIRVMLPSERLRSNGDAKIPDEGIGFHPHLNATNQNPIPLAREVLSCLMDDTCAYLVKQLGLKI